MTARAESSATHARQAFAVRHARIEDAADIAWLSTESGYANAAADIHKRLRTLLELPTHAVFVLTDDEGLHGFVTAEHRLLLETGERVDILGLVVEEGRRRQGAGSALLTAAELWAFKRGVACLQVCASGAEAAVQAFCQALGYQDDCTQRVFRKQLDAH